MFRRHLILLSTVFVMTSYASAQTNAGEAIQDTLNPILEQHFIQSINDQVFKVEQGLSQATMKSLKQLNEWEQQLIARVGKIDSVKGKELTVESIQSYQQLTQRLKKPTPLRNYIPSLDTLSGAFSFLGQQGQLSPATGKMLESGLTKVSALKHHFQKADELKQFIEVRQIMLREKLQGLPLNREWKRGEQLLTKYSQRVNEYKMLLKDRRKLEKKAWEIITGSNAFKTFMQKHGQLAGLFQLPGSNAVSSNFSNLQPRSQVQSIFQQQGAMSLTGSNQLMQQAQAGLTTIKQRIDRINGGAFAGDNLDFAKANEKRKSLLSKLDYAIDIQSARHNSLFPTTTDIGLSVGYNPVKKWIAGIGISYKIGWGKNIQDLKVTHEGVGLRTFLDVQLKRQLFIAGGYELNQFTQIRNVDQLKDRSAWKTSALLGLSKKYKVGKKNGEMKILYDFFNASKVPKTQAFLFRVGIGL